MGADAMTQQASLTTLVQASFSALSRGQMPPKDIVATLISKVRRGQSAEPLRQHGGVDSGRAADALPSDSLSGHHTRVSVRVGTARCHLDTRGSPRHGPAAPRQFKIPHHQQVVLQMMRC